MIIYLPCRLGEEFAEQKYVCWENGKRIYKEGEKRILKGFDKGLYNPTINANGKFLTYDATGENSQDFIPKYKVSIPLGKQAKLSEMGFPGSRSVKLFGICLKEGKVTAEFVTTDRYEQLFYPIKDNLNYANIDEPVMETSIEYCKSHQTGGQLTIFDIKTQ